jgi:hypothetical protein
MEKAKIGARMALWVCGMVLLGTVAALAQEATGGKEDKPGTKQCCGMMEGMMGEGKMKGEGMMAQMHTTHDQMARMRQEMLREQQEQLTALHKHSQEMDRLTDEGQMMEAVKKHLRMTDALLETMVEQHAKMQGKMEEQHQQMQGQQKAKQQTAEENKPAGHEEHHEGE